MNPRIKRLLSLLLALTMVFSLTTPVSASAASATAASGNTVEIEVGETAKLKVSGVYSKTTWTSSDEEIATVSSDGTVTGVAPGTATITATSKSFFSFWGGTKTTTFTVVVTEPEEGLPVKVGETLQLEVETSGGTVTWKSSDNGIATVDSNGLVTGISEGDVTITATEKKTTGNGFWFFWWGSGKTTTTVTEFKVTVLPADEQPTEPPVTEPPVVTYTVTFESNGGSEVEAQTIEEGQTATEPEAPTMDGYTFAGWYADAELTEAYDFASPVTSDITLYAAWEETEIIYTVTFETNGGSAVIEQAIYAGECAFRPADPTKEGYVFENWYADAELTVLFDFTQPINADTTIYANWTDLNVIITLDAGDYADNIVNRTVTGSIAYNIAIDSITYELVSASSTTTGEIDLTEAESFAIDVLLEDGDNVLTVSVATADGSVVSESVTMTYDSGYVYDSGEVYDQYDERLIKIPIWYSEDTTGDPDEYLVANILSLYFYDHVTFEEREAFIIETLGGEVAGYLNSLDMMQVLLPNPIINAEEVGYTGETDLTAITEDEVWEYADAIAEAYSDILDSVDPEYIYTNMELTITTNDPWDDGADDDWWLELIDAYDAWEYDNYFNCDFLGNISLGAVDSGFMRSHTDLTGNVAVISSEDSIDDHGTHVTGIMVGEANNGAGIAGVMYNNGYVYGYDVGGSGGISDSSIKAGLTKAVESGAKVINFSLGQSGSIKSGTYTLSASTIKNQGKTWSKNMGKLIAKGNDFIVVQSAGNGNKDGIGVDYWNNGLFCSIKNENCYSSNGGQFSDAVTKQEIMNRILIVAAVDSSNTMTSFSNGGNGELNIIAAPGAYMLSTVTGNSYTDSNGITHANRNAYHTYYNRPHLVTNDPVYAYMQGTSMAAPVVTAVCGMTWSVNKHLTGAEVVSLVMNNAGGTATTNSNAHTTGGMRVVNALEAVKAAIESRTTYTLTVVDALNGEGIAATIKIHTDSPDGPLVGSQQIYYSNSDGSFSFPKLPSDIYWLEISAEGYVSNLVYANCWGSRAAVQHLGTVALTPEMNEEEYRIILRWIGEPSDLDSHLVANTVEGDAYHVYYSNKNPSPAYANLDWDDTDYEGPETITITNFSGLRNIRYAVHDFTNRNSTSSTVMSNSGAYVEVYRGSTLINTFYVPTNTGGTEWDVFAIDANGNIIPMNQMTYCSSPGNVLSNTSSVSVNAVSVMSAADKKPYTAS